MLLLPQLRLRSGSLHLPALGYEDVHRGETHQILPRHALQGGQAVGLAHQNVLKDVPHAPGIAEGDAGKMAFLADGKTALLLWRSGQWVSVVPPKGLIIVDEYLRQEQNVKKRRFVLAHEAGHILMDRLGNNPVTSAFSQEFDAEQKYTVKELATMFNIAESMATAMGVALLMPRTSVVRYVRSRGYEKRIPL